MTLIEKYDFEEKLCFSEHSAFLDTGIHNRSKSSKFGYLQNVFRY